MWTRAPSRIQTLMGPRILMDNSLLKKCANCSKEFKSCKGPTNLNCFNKPIHREKKEWKYRLSVDMQHDEWGQCSWETTLAFCTFHDYQLTSHPKTRVDNEEALYYSFPL
mmetsp:Transcript_35450/g.48424  ORF Transcript_35450/g.48424 Transcript_35450/m.48424 type:complete len:110 (-) Transcript_35450:123-452(-)